MMKGIPVHRLSAGRGRVGGFNQERARAIMEDELGKLDYPMAVTLVLFRMGQRAGLT